MGNKSRFVIAESKIKTFFNQNNKKTFSREQLIEIFNERKALWNLPMSMFSDKFIEQLEKKEILKKIIIQFDGSIFQKQRFILKDATIYQIATSLINKSYLSHYTALYLSGLTTQVPKVIYISFEQSKKINVNRKLTQEAIDNAFSKAQRTSATKAIYENYTFYIHNGMYSNRAGITTIEDIPVTSIERTLIDITVRPNYAGGVFSVLEAYKKAINTISLSKLMTILDNINYIYPYYQSVGFYLEKAGYEGKLLNEFEKKISSFNFYLTYEMKEKNYSTKWKLYYPKGM